MRLEPREAPTICRLTSCGELNRDAEVGRLGIYGAGEHGVMAFRLRTAPAPSVESANRSGLRGR